MAGFGMNSGSAMATEAAMDNMDPNDVAFSTGFDNGPISATDMISDEDDLGMDTSQPDDAAVTAEVKRVYHQDPTPLGQRADTSNLWQVPILDPKGVRSYPTHPIVKHFFKTCSLIAKHWKVEIEDVVPKEMRAQTPYSQALLLAIRRLASNTKGRFDAAQLALVSAWRDRVGTPSGLPFNPAGMQVLETNVKQHFHNFDFDQVEQIIQETNYGLTLADVATALKGGRQAAKIIRAQASQPRGKLRGAADPARRAEARKQRAEKRANNKLSLEANLANRQENHSNTGASKVKKRERKQASKMREKLTGEKGYKLLQFLQGEEDSNMPLGGASDATTTLANGGSLAAPPNSPEVNSTETLASPDHAMQELNHNNRRRPRRIKGESTDPSALSNKQDRHNDHLLSQMFNRVGMEGKQGLRRKKMNKLMDEATKRQGNLPTDRIKLGEITSLHASQGSRREAEALEGLGKMQVKMEEHGVKGQSVFASEPTPGTGSRVIAVLSDEEEL